MSEPDQPSLDSISRELARSGGVDALEPEETPETTPIPGEP